MIPILDPVHLGWFKHWPDAEEHLGLSQSNLPTKKELSGFVYNDWNVVLFSIEMVKFLLKLVMLLLKTEGKTEEEEPEWEHNDIDWE